MRSRLPILVVAAVFLALALPALHDGERSTFDAYDEGVFHLPTIRAFMADWPAFDLAKMQATTGPLYHALLATAGVAFGLDVSGLRLVNLLISVCCLWAIWENLRRRPSGRSALLFTLIVALSPYFFGGAVRLMTDDAALLFAVLSLSVIEQERGTVRWMILANAAILLAVLTRQSYVWLLGVYAISVGARTLRAGAVSLPSVIRACLPALLPVLGLAALAFAWGGTTPPGFRGEGRTLNTEAPLFVVSMLGAYGCVLALGLREMRREAGVPFGALGAAAVSGVILLFLHPLSNEYPLILGDSMRRGGWLWLVASRTPNLGATAALFWLLLPIGIVSAVIMIRHARAKGERLWGWSFALLVVSSVILPWTYQKYSEPLLLFSLGQRFGHGEGWRWQAGPILLLCAFAAMTLSRYVLA